MKFIYFSVMPFKGILILKPNKLPGFEQKASISIRNCRSLLLQLKIPGTLSRSEDHSQGLKIVS